MSLINHRGYQFLTSLYGGSGVSEMRVYDYGGEGKMGFNIAGYGVFDGSMRTKVA